MLQHHQMQFIYVVFLGHIMKYSIYRKSYSEFEEQKKNYLYVKPPEYISDLINLLVVNQNGKGRLDLGTFILLTLSQTTSRFQQQTMKSGTNAIVSR